MSVNERNSTQLAQIASAQQVAQQQQVAPVTPDLDEWDQSAQRYWADQAAQGKPFESQLREACERNGIEHGLGEEGDTDV